MINQRSLDLVSCQLIDDSTRTITESEKFDLKKLQVLTKQTNSIRFASAIQFDQGEIFGEFSKFLVIFLLKTVILERNSYHVFEVFG